MRGSSQHFYRYKDVNKIIYPIYNTFFYLFEKNEDIKELNEVRFLVTEIRNYLYINEININYTLYSINNSNCSNCLNVYINDLYIVDTIFVVNKKIKVPQSICEYIFTDLRRNIALTRTNIDICELLHLIEDMETSCLSFVKLKSYVFPQTLKYYTENTQNNKLLFTYSL